MSKWIPIYYYTATEGDGEEVIRGSGALPEYGQQVLITDGCGNVRTDIFDGDEDGYFFEETDIEDVTAWMPLPQAYDERTDRSRILRAVGRYIQTQAEQEGLKALGVNGIVYDVEDVLQDLDAIIREEEGET